MTSALLPSLTALWAQLRQAAAGEAFTALLMEVFGASAAAAEALRQQLLDGSELGLAFELVEGEALEGELSRYGPGGSDGVGMIGVSSALVAEGADGAQLETVLMAAIGQHIAVLLESEPATARELGQRFAEVLLVDTSARPPVWQVLADEASDAVIDPALQERANALLVEVQAALAARAGEAAFLDLLTEIFGAADRNAEAFEQAAAELIARLRGGDDLGLRFELETGAELAGVRGAYAAVGDNGVPTVYINADWAAAASDAELRLLLLEEIGHHFDTLLNGEVDTPGDEGQLFAALFSGIELSAEERAAIASEGDQRTLTIDGEQVLVEAGVASTNGVVINTANTTLNATTATSGRLNYTITVDSTNNHGADLLVAAYS
ncbi:MAG: hypothetical protein R6W06_09245, partial [Prochlorococcaceae cyanobacterium]